ncbi:30S ribosomal protein S21 [Candidatus Megaera venefica]|uniref:Small ribosomal subunit protein bS21 n=1 Tax=Candidatus Megaera venefica TaxID=2055910 RepID=A0ABU5NDL3_9RICK|nr:30S ribosomal protein S21 [Candidatus Megaera venefica]MCF8493798.1 30S ribosomal protein S21 [Rickettsiaceae bacterium]MEA0971262.1 30S ribosomal protein S21 [Candidatus Megaera venefica]
MAVHISVHGGNSEKAISDLKRKMQRELVFRQMKTSRFYETPSSKRVREKQESDRRIRKNNRRKRMEG